jgi:hypothetical protein
MTRRRRTPTISSGTAALETDARQNCRLIERFNLARGLGERASGHETTRDYLT